MTKLSFSALVRIPNEAYFKFNTSLDGIAVVDSISREGDDYHGNISFDMNKISECIQAVTSCSGSIIEMVPEKIKATAAVTNYAKQRRGVIGTYKPRGGNNTKIAKLRAAMTDWRSVKELVKMTKSSPTTIHSRFTKFKSHNILQSKNGPDGKKVYRLAAAAA